MEITLILGNGFDKNLGLKTSYKEFYDEYQKKDTNIEIVKKMKTSIGRFLDGTKKGEDIINWGDAELAFGKFSKQCQTYEEYRLCYEDLEDNLIEYLKEKEKEFDISKISEEKIIDCINKVIKLINDINENNILNIITLNYTSCVYEVFYKVRDKLKDQKNSIVLKDFIYLHDGLTGEVAFGLGKIEQITNEKLIKVLPKGFIDQIIKNRQDGLTSRNHYSIVDRIINRSQALYCYGWSFGDTDLVLINKIANAVKHGKQLYVFQHGFELKSSIRKSSEEKIFNDEKKETIINRLLTHGSITNNSIAYVENHVILTCVNYFESIKNVV